MIILQDASSNLDAYADKNQVYCCGSQKNKKDEAILTFADPLTRWPGNFAVSHNNGADGLDLLLSLCSGTCWSIDWPATHRNA